MAAARASIKSSQILILTNLQFESKIYPQLLILEISSPAIAKLIRVKIV